MAEIIDMPKLGFDMAEGTLVRWLIAEGETVQKGQVLAEIETDKATVEVESSASGVLAHRMVEEGAVVPVGDPIAVIAEPGEKVDIEKLKAAPAQAAEPAKEKSAPAEPPKEPAALENVEAVRQEAVEAPLPPAEADERVKASPLARRMAAEAGVPLGQITGSGPGGRVVKQDVERALASPVGQTAQPAVSAGQLPAWQPAAAPQPDQRLPVERLRALIGKRMLESKQQLPHFYITSEVDAAALMTLRKQANEILPEEEKFSVNDFVVKSAALALRQFPNLNSSLDGQEIVRHGRVNVGVAVALEAGLITVVCKDADQKPLRFLSQEIKGMVARARQGKVRQDDIEGSTFSISNLGMYDVDDFIAIINPPEAAILAVGSVKEMAVVEGGAVKAGLRMKITLSADHRITDGAEAARFMQALTGFLENPVWMLL